MSSEMENLIINNTSVKNLTVNYLLECYRNNIFSPAQLINALLVRAKKFEAYNSWIYLMSMEEVQPYLDSLQPRPMEELPLYGIPFAIKDNIDLTGIPTTAACEAFSYTPEKSAFVVQRLIDAGAVPLGKANLDQFATGLVGTRSPYGATKNSFNAEYISGGSSSGSAVVVAQGLASFSLGTDTAGSGRVPAAFNNILGMKTSRGLLSNTGVVPACKSLDCVAIFATTTEDLNLVFNVTAVHDKADPYSRHNTKSNQTSLLQYKNANPGFVFAVPKQDQLQFFGNTAYEGLFNQAIHLCEQLGGIKEEIDFQPFMDTAKLLYEGPWVAERYLACSPLIDERPESLLDVTRSIIAPGKELSATLAFSSQYKLNGYKQYTDKVMGRCDFLLTPTAGTIYTIDEVSQNPVTLNSNLGYYTNYMNLLDYAAIAIPAGIIENSLPFGITLSSSAFHDQKLLAFANELQQSFKLPLGATNWLLPKNSSVVRTAVLNNVTTMKLVVCGAHLSELALNHQLTDRDAVLVKQCKSAPKYKLVALPGGPPERPGMIRKELGGVAIDVEVWQIPIEQAGSFLAGIPHPLGLGQVELDDGSWETGFVCEGYIQSQSTDISHFGGWRAYIESINK